MYVKYPHLGGSGRGMTLAALRLNLVGFGTWTVFRRFCICAKDKNYRIQLQQIGYSKAIMFKA